MGVRRHELTDQAWAEIAPLLGQVATQEPPYVVRSGPAAGQATIPG
jgi:hypothetical protein